MKNGARITSPDWRSELPRPQFLCSEPMSSTTRFGRRFRGILQRRTLTLESLETRATMSTCAGVQVSDLHSGISAAAVHAATVHAADAGSTMGTADSLGTLSGNQSFAGSVGGFYDPSDV